MPSEIYDLKCDMEKGCWDATIKKAAIEYVSDQFNDKAAPIFELLDDLKERLAKKLGVSGEPEKKAWNGLD